MISARVEVTVLIKCNAVDIPDENIFMQCFQA